MVISVSKLLTISSSTFGIPVYVISSKRCEMYVVRIRQLVANKARSFKKEDNSHVHTLKHIAWHLKRKHSTIIHLIEQHENDLKIPIYKAMSDVFDDIINNIPED